MIVEIRDPECNLVDTVEAEPECGDSCDRCGDCLHCCRDETCRRCRWVLYTDIDAARVAELYGALLLRLTHRSRKL